MIFRIILAMLLLLLTGCQTISIAETGVYSGQTYGHTSHHFQTTPIRTQALMEMNRVGAFRILAGPELITDVVSHPQRGYLVGISPIAKATFTWEDFVVFLESGAGPSYLSVRTKEQGGPGFNFIDQVGGGLEYRVIDRLEVVGKYRFSHISHAGVRNDSNNGIDSHSVQFGFKVDF